MSPRLKLLAFILVAAQAVCAQDVRIGVLGLFRTHQLIIKSSPGQALIVRSGKQSFVLERSSGQQAASVTLSDDGMVLHVGDQQIRAASIHAANRSGGVADFVLAIPGKISRHYQGVLEIKASGGVLVPIVTMELETAVASVVQAENSPDTPLEAMKAQAVATRSYLVAGQGRHHDFDFCDSTHCQFLREPAAPDSSAARAALATRGLVLAYREKAVATMFTRSCGGHTRTAQEAGIPHQAYPYFAVACDYCLRNPMRWVRRLSPAEADDLSSRGESSRLDIDRRRGWAFVPSNNFTMQRGPDGVLLHGAGQGHGMGLCQAGARAMAEAGSGFQEILDHYYPNTTLVNADQLQRSGGRNRG
ncbi:MAG TPA: SpoIID/LytB domain-containing protein [Terriglobales bacterium]|jgi:stage II sporulation protein D|nr:SpoIID/LytB domain-containing protein [Terriglobales bacterium]